MNLLTDEKLILAEALLHSLYMLKIEYMYALFCITLHGYKLYIFCNAQLENIANGFIVATDLKLSDHQAKINIRINLATDVCNC